MLSLPQSPRSEAVPHLSLEGISVLLIIIIIKPLCLRGTFMIVTPHILGHEFMVQWNLSIVKHRGCHLIIGLNDY